MNLDRAFAQQIVPPINPSDLGGRDWSNLDQVADFVISLVIPVLAGLAVLFLIWAGYQYITSTGDPAKAEKARANLIYAVIGVILVLVSYGLVNLLEILSRGAR